MTFACIVSLESGKYLLKFLTLIKKTRYDRYTVYIDIHEGSLAEGCLAEGGVTEGSLPERGQTEGRRGGVWLGGTWALEKVLSDFLGVIFAWSGKD